MILMLVAVAITAFFFGYALGHREGVEDGYQEFFDEQARAGEGRS